MASSEDRQAFKTLEARLKTILPEEYQDNYEDVQPVSMGSAGLKYDTQGHVAWDDMWDTFCDLAMAGGPPHKGALLEPGCRAEISAQPELYSQVIEELCRGINLVTDLEAKPSATPGWVEVDCGNSTMAGWLLRAIVMENVSARIEGAMLLLPAGPGYRLEKEVKNVITVIAKTSHYWQGHLRSGQQRAIADVFAKLEAQSPLIEPALPGQDLCLPQQTAHLPIAETVQQTTGLRPATAQYAGWLGFECPHVRSAIWIMRALVVSNVLSRREGTVLFVPVNPERDPEGERVVQTLARIHGFARARGVL